MQITFGIDLRRTSPLNPDVPVPEVVPIIVQGINVYQPASFIPGPTSSEWTTVAPVTYDLSAFVSSSGVPLNLSQEARIGFWIRTSGPSALPSGTAYGVGVDNVTITIIPAPTTGVLMGVAVLGMPRVTGRRRR
ncbi:MAG: hypothetical protein IBJ18_14415 [Phycisphaerales bacterium]|nr:hypothetical protein [Phycisphaerales bacterium]